MELEDTNKRHYKSLRKKLAKLPNLRSGYGC